MQFFTENVGLYFAIAFIVVENIIELYFFHQVSSIFRSILNFQKLNKKIQSIKHFKLTKEKRKIRFQPHTQTSLKMAPLQ